MAQAFPEPTRLKGTEQPALYEFFGALTLLEHTGIENRISTIPDGKRKLSLTRTTVTQLMEALMQTIPTNQLLSIKRTIPLLNVRVGVISAGTRSELKDFGCVISWENLEALVAASREQCLMCDLSRASMAKCQLHTAFAALPYDGAICL